MSTKSITSRRRGRPPKNGNGLRNRIELRVDDETMAHITTWAAALGHECAQDYVRALVDKDRQAKKKEGVAPPMIVSQEVPKAS
ncbi:hypothetical protein SUDANB95_07946 (plasmid) [Actinosynnema sp. ALI-1.44]